MNRLSFFCLLLMLFLPLGARAETQRLVVIDVHGTLWPGMATYVAGQIEQAWRTGASGVVLDLDTTRGSAEAADVIKTAVVSRARSLPIAAFVHDRALGAGSVVAVACKTLALSPSASLGGAVGGVSKADLSGAAAASGRNPAIAAAFVSADAALPSLGVAPSETLTLSASQAASVGYADVVAPDISDVAAKMGLAGAAITPVHLDGWTAVALWVSQPWATILLLALGLALVVVEFLTWHTWGIAGIVGGLLVALIFASHITVGAATWVGIALFLIGITLLLLETHVFPGHGLSAFAGLILIFLGMFYALGGTQTGAIYSASAALLTCVATIAAFFLYLPRSRVWNKLGQPMRQSAIAGYVSSDDYTGFVGHVGTTVTALRPSGTADVEGMRLAVVSEGDFVPAGASVQVVLVQGSRVVVRAS